jgi:hypothetical protein
MYTVWRVCVLCLGFASGFCLPAPCYGWGAAGHRFITQAAIRELPPPLKAFFERYQTQVSDIAATEPPGTHFIDIDYYPEFFTHTFPRDSSVLTAEYGQSVVNQNGTGPWTAVGLYESLTNSFVQARTESDWTNLLSNAGQLAHYLEDLHNPMHLAMNYDGRLTGQAGLHSRFESTLIQQRLNAGLQLATNVLDCMFYPSMQDAIFDDIDLVYPYNTHLLAADLSAYAAAGERTSTTYYQHLWDDGCSSFTPAVMQKAAGMVASAWYSAWRDAGFPQPFNVPASRVVTLHLLSVENAGTADCRLAITGDAGQRLELQTSTNFTDWAWPATLTNLDGRIEISAPRRSDGAGLFYRVRLLP